MKGKWALFAKITPTDDLIAMNKAAQKVYTSMEIQPNFANTGKCYLVGLAVILRTPVGSRVMRRDYGSLLASMIDQPQTPALELQIKVACYMAVLKWEPRVTLSSVTTARSFDGRMTVTLTGQHNDTGQPLSLTIPVS
ncbi:TPA: hypothetical protein J1088_003154 [Escherichia coli]|nr:hypothetical protein [Escherichia coli]